MNESLALSKAPELFFGLVAPIGVDLDLVTGVLDETLHEMDYETQLFRFTKLMREVPLRKPLGASRYIQSIQERIAYANEVRRHLGDDALASLAVSAVRAFRAKKRKSEKEAGRSKADPPAKGESPEETPLSKQAYIFRQIKRPEEVALL